MFNADDPLLHHIVATFNDPDPDRALRFRPFVYGSVRHRLAAESVTVPPASARSESRVATFFKTARRIVVRGQVGAIPNCEPACC